MFYRPQEEVKPPFYIDELAIIMILFSLTWLTLGMALFQGETEKMMKIYFLLFFLLTGLTGSVLVVKAKIKREFTYKNMAMALVYSAPFILLGAKNVFASPTPQVTSLAVAFNISVAVSEELFFRGFLFTTTKKLVKGWLGVAIAYLSNMTIFGIYHTKSYGFQTAYLIYPFIFTLLFCAILDISKRISYIFIAHAAYNILIATAMGGVIPL